MGFAATRIEFPEYAYVTAILADPNNEIRPSPITENKYISMPILLPLFLACFVVRMVVKLTDAATAIALPHEDVLFCL